MPRPHHSSSDAVSLAGSPDGTRIAAAPSLEGVRVWEAASGEFSATVLRRVPAEGIAG